MVAEPKPTAQSGMALLSEMLLATHRSDALASILAAVSAGMGRFGAVCQLGCLVHDSGTDGWFLTALIDAAGKPILFERLEITPGPFPFHPPATPVSGTLLSVFGDAWGEQPCARLERITRSSMVVVAPIATGGASLGALFALVPGVQHVSLLGAVLAHAAVAAGRCLPGSVGDGADGVLEAAAFAEISERELLRAERYRREVSVAVFGMDSTREVARFGPMLVRTLRRWDVVGRPNSSQPILAALLPETGRTGGRGLVRRLRRLTGSMPVGTACAPEDGWKLDQLLQTATNAMKLAHSYRAPANLGVEQLWSRGLAATSDSETIRCPRCLASYVRRRPVGLTDGLLDEQREAARALLRASCPNHAERVTVVRPERR